jgi:hypothetical protein
MPVFNNMSLPLAEKFVPRGELRILGGMFTLLSHPGVNTIYCLEKWMVEYRDKDHP